MKRLFRKLTLHADVKVQQYLMTTIAASYVHSIIYRQIDSTTTTTATTDSFSTLDGNEMKLIVFEALSEVDPVLHIVLHHTEVVQLGVVAGS